MLWTVEFFTIGITLIQFPIQIQLDLPSNDPIENILRIEIKHCCNPVLNTTFTFPEL